MVSLSTQQVIPSTWILFIFDKYEI